MKISPKKYAQALARTLENKEDPRPVIRNFLELLRRRHMFRSLPKILRAFEEEWRLRRGVVKAQITYPARFKSAADDLQKTLTAKLEKQIEIEAIPSETIIGGVRMRIGDRLVDASIESRLALLKAHLTH